MEFRVETVGQAGDGVVTADGERVFVPFTAPGDLIELRVEPQTGRGSPRRGRIGRLIEGGPERVEPPCRHFGRCGGCALQHLSEGFLADWKRAAVITALGRRGFEEPPVAPTCRGGPARRRRAVFTARADRRGAITLGFHERRGRALVDIGECPVAEPEIEALIPALKLAMEGLLRPRGEARLTVNLTDAGADLLIAGDLTESLALHERLADFAAARDLARLSLQRAGDAPTTLVERRRPELRWPPLSVAPPPGAFLQADRRMEARMRELVAEWSADAGRAADLFCGVGTLASALPLRARDLAADSDAAAVAALKAGIDRAPGVELETAVRNLQRRPFQAGELSGFGLVMLDPPAAGAREQCEQIARSGVARVIYVSCAPATFARDARILADAGFRLAVVEPLDQFFWAPDVELAALLVRD